MSKKEKGAAFLGIFLFLVAALFSISLISGLLDFGAADSSFLGRLGKILISAYGFCSVLIPVYFLTAGIFCFGTRWTLQKAVGLLISIVPFFTLVFAEKGSRNIFANDMSAVAFMKIIFIECISIIFALLEYFISFIIASRIYSGKRKVLSEQDENSDEDENDENENESEEADLKSEDETLIDDPALKEETEISEAEINVAEENEDADETDVTSKTYDDIWSLDENGNPKNAESESENIENDSVEEDDSDEELPSQADPWNVIRNTRALENIDVVDLSDIVPQKNNDTEKADAEISKASVESVSAEKNELDDIISSFEQDSIGFEKNSESEEKDKIVYDIKFDEETDDSEENEKSEENLNFAATNDSEEEDEAYEDFSSGFTYEDVSNEYADEIKIEDDQVPDEEESDSEESEIAEPEFTDAAETETGSESDEDEESNLSAEEELLKNLPDFTEKEDASDDEILNDAISVAVAYDKAVEEKNQKDSEENVNLDLSANNVFNKMDEDVKAEIEEKNKSGIDMSKTAVVTDENGNTKPIPVKPKKRHGPYKISTELLTKYDADPYWEIDKETEQAGEHLKETLKEFNIEADVTAIRKGPVVTMFEILPAPGVNLNKIRALQDNIALRLAAKSVRIVAPIPGKRAVGIEIPNKNRAVVSFRECIEEKRGEWNKMQIPVVLGKDIEGETQIMDLAKTPHLLIAGATGAGKSVCVNSMILSILYKRSPADVKMILIDPKIVELSLYNDIGHLLTPVITEPKAAMQALNYCICEMERRYAVLKSLGCREIVGYNQKIKEQKICTEKLPYIVIVIDEFADLMATTGKQMESAVARLAAKSRAVGIHLVLATQRPSVDVITGLIKANIPSRIAFMVASRQDSGIIIDKTGAEKLLGKGDMLYASATDPFPIRIQGTLVSDEEVDNVVEAVKENWGEPEYINDEIFIDDEEGDDSGQMNLFTDGADDPLYEKALDIVVQSGRASASYIQRKLSIGYNRAARLVELMEERGIVGPANGSKPREIIQMP